MRVLLQAAAYLHDVVLAGGRIGQQERVLFALGVVEVVVAAVLLHIHKAQLTYIHKHIHSTIDDKQSQSESVK